MTLPTPTSTPPVLETDILSSPGPFEGPEKLLEVWFAPSASALPETSAAGAARYRPAAVQREWKGLRRVPRAVWEEMLDIVKCKVLSVVEGAEVDAYLLSESSLFVAPHLLILKTCGTTLNLLGLHRIIEIARAYCGFTTVWRCFYSRKSFFFPERQSGPHRDWRDEVTFLDSVFGAAGSAYTVGPMNRDHWLLYLTSPNAQPLLPSDASLSSDFSLSLSLPSPPALDRPSTYQDSTIEILMSHLSPEGRAPFFAPSPAPGPEASGTLSGHELGAQISHRLGIDTLFSRGETTLDSFGFEPCGYSANAVVGSGSPETNIPGGGYFTIHVTPEDGWSYASFESNIPLPQTSTADRPDIATLIRKVVGIFQPSRLSITLFVSTPPEGGIGESEAERRAWSALGTDLLGREFARKDRIGYEFDGYDLVFACFEKRGWVEPKSRISAKDAVKGLQNGQGQVQER
ncbi:adenosylmethionine decarboxylase [Naematelia encephala]|uniref:adenosylmethionine decarboxylase n=1 Tax=Naematelia encephala TaxID=71784 RepID=A0A1Y2BCN7_9TREE|nr:adenosylmethionine decarboxylase [Naematelia encephala]